MAETPNLPAEPMSQASLVTERTAMGLRIWFDDKLFERVRTVAGQMAKAEGATPRHLLNKPESCFFVVEQAINWNLSPFMVARATYQTPGGQIGYMGTLCQAIIESSGKLQGGLEFEHFGSLYYELKDGPNTRKKTFRSNEDVPEEWRQATLLEERTWENVAGKFEIAESQKKDEHGKPLKYTRPTWTQKDAAGLGVTVSAQLKGETRPRVLHFYLTQAWPRNSTLWATDPMTQIKYTATRRFGTSVVPTLMMGVPFDREDYGEVIEHEPAPATPRPTMTPAAATSEPPAASTVEPEPASEPIDQDGEGNVVANDEQPREEPKPTTFPVVNEVGEITSDSRRYDDFADDLTVLVNKTPTLQGLQLLHDNNDATMQRLPAGVRGRVDDAFESRAAKLKGGRLL